MNTLIALLFAVLPITEDPFSPKVIPTNEVSVALAIQKQNRLSLVEATIEGVKTMLLFDTGASHTTFDRDFVEKNLPKKQLEPIMLVGQTNVRALPASFQVKSLKLGEVEFGEFTAMTIPLKHLSSSVGCRVDGIVGMNLIKPVRTRISLADSKVTFNPLRTSTVIASSISTTETKPCLSAKFGDIKAPLLIDSGATFTFLNKELWPATTNTLEISATGVNGKENVRPVRGEKGTIDLGGPIEIEPLLVGNAQNMLGADTLQRYDLLVDWPRISFCPPSPSARR